MNFFVLSSVIVFLLVASISFAHQEEEISSNSSTSTSTTFLSETTGTETTTVSSSTVSTSITAATTSYPPPPTQNYTVVEFNSLEACFTNTSSDIISINVYPFSSCTVKSSNGFNVSLSTTYLNSSFIRAVSYSGSADCEDSPTVDVQSTLFQIGTCYSNTFDGPALYTYLGDAPFSPAVVSTTSSTSSSATSSSLSSTTTMSSSTTTIVNTTPTPTSTTVTTTYPPEEFNYVRLAIFNDSSLGTCTSSQEQTVVYKTKKCYFHTQDSSATAFVWLCNNSFAVKKYFNHSGNQECDQNLYEPSKTEVIQTNDCQPFHNVADGKTYSAEYKCIANDPNNNNNGEDSAEEQRKQTIMIAAGAGAAVVLLVSIVVLFLIWKNKSSSEGNGNNNRVGAATGRRFEYQMNTTRQNDDDDVMYTEVRPEV